MGNLVRGVASHAAVVVGGVDGGGGDVAIRREVAAARVDLSLPGGLEVLRGGAGRGGRR